MAGADSYVSTYNDQKDTTSETRHEAFNKAKWANGIPLCTQPFSDELVNEIRNGIKTGNKLRQYLFKNEFGKTIAIREDPETIYAEGRQDPHFNAGEHGEKLKQHHYFKRKNAR